MERFLGRYEPYIYAALRIVVGFLFMLHGTQKMLGFPASGRPAQALDIMSGTAGAIELACGFLILIGFFAGFAAFLASGLMAFAYFIAHQPRGILPIQNGGEPAVLYCFVMLYIAARGSGLLSVDAALNRNGTRTAEQV